MTRLILDTPPYRRAIWSGRSSGVAIWPGDRRPPGAGRRRRPYPALAAEMAVSAFNTVLQFWRAGDDVHRLAALTDRCFAIIAPALDAPSRPGRDRRPGCDRRHQPANRLRRTTDTVRSFVP
ncbi:hypothetical protein NKG94_02070 [Micromonospora sp. M12]